MSITDGLSISCPLKIEHRMHSYFNTLITQSNHLNKLKLKLILLEICTLFLNAISHFLS